MFNLYLNIAYWTLTLYPLCAVHYWVSECVCVMCAYERRSFLRFLLQKVIGRFCEEFVFYGTFHPICLHRLSTLSSPFFVIQKNKIIKMLPLVVNFSSSFFQKTLSNRANLNQHWMDAVLTDECMRISVLKQMARTASKILLAANQLECVLHIILIYIGCQSKLMLQLSNYHFPCQQTNFLSINQYIIVLIELFCRSSKCTYKAWWMVAINQLLQCNVLGLQ